MAADAVREVLAHAAPRTRVVDDHMFAVNTAPAELGTFRLQLFTAPGTRPIAVAVQSFDESPPLEIVAEQYAGAVWQRHAPRESVPPIWIERRMTRGGLVEEHSNLVVFNGLYGPYLPADPDWHRISDEELAQLVGRPVDLSRGKSYVPRPLEPEPETRYVVTPSISSVGDAYDCQSFGVGSRMGSTVLAVVA